MDKETLIRLAQPAATVALAISILSIPILTKADVTSGMTGRYSHSPIYVRHVNSCN